MVEADEQKTAKNWFAATFHLRWLAELEPNNPEWKERLTKAKEHLAEAAKTKPADSGKAPANRKEADKKLRNCRRGTERASAAAADLFLAGFADLPEKAYVFRDALKKDR